MIELYISFLNNGFFLHWDVLLFFFSVCSSELGKVVYFGAFWAFRRKADMSLDDVKMKSGDFLEKQHLDSGGFGKVSLCLHRSHGLVILRKVYTGPKRNEWVGSRGRRPNSRLALGSSVCGGRGQASRPCGTGFRMRQTVVCQRTAACPITLQGGYLRQSMERKWKGFVKIDWLTSFTFLVRTSPNMKEKT